MSAYLYTNPDGADPKSKAVLAYLQDESNPIAGDSYLYGPFVARWENGREQGYVVYLRTPNGRQVNIAFYEHRSADIIVAVEWYQRTMNSPNIDSMDAPHYNRSGDFDFEVEYCGAYDMAQWVHERLFEFWHSNLTYRVDDSDKTIEGCVVPLRGN